MRKLASLLLALTMTQAALAEDGNRDALLNKVTLRLSAEQWVATKTALVTVGVNASVNANGLDKVQDDVLKQLTSISAGDWHIVSFDRSLDSSGLEKVQITAQIRLPSSSLSNLRDKAKSISKPGETFTLDNVEFTPSEQELRDANTALRSNIYDQAKDEADRLNKQYPEQKYYVHGIDFINLLVPITPQPVNFMAMRAMAGGNNNAANNNLAVGDKLQISATIVLASAPDHPLVKNIT